MNGTDPNSLPSLRELGAFRARKRNRKPFEKDYTVLGQRIMALCGTQFEISRIIGVCQSQVSRRLTGEIEFSAAELVAVATHFNVPVGLFFEKMELDSETIDDVYRMFQYNPIALDWVIEAFKKEHKNLVRLGRIAEEMCKGT